MLTRPSDHFDLRQVRTVSATSALRLALVCLIFSALSALSCSVPVFRYALERWPASPYEVLVFHRGPLLEPQRGLISRLGMTNIPPANIAVQTVDLSANVPEPLREVWIRHQAEGLPLLVLRYPAGSTAQGEVWAGPLANVASLLDSPARRRLAQRLIKGDSAVWILLESGDRTQDEAAARLLQARLDHLQKTLQLPKLEAVDIADQVISVPESELRLAFSLQRLSRVDPAEQILVRMLLGSEEDLGDQKEPMAFPIFGRGRALFALVGKGLNDETIDEACLFLTGACSCVVKEENPGVDLLLSVDWDNQVRIQSTAAPEPPALTGLTAIAAKSNTATAFTNSAAPLQTPTTERGGTMRKAWLVLGIIGAVGLVAGTLVVRRRMANTAKL